MPTKPLLYHIKVPKVHFEETTCFLKNFFLYLTCFFNENSNLKSEAKLFFKKILTC